MTIFEGNYCLKDTRIELLLLDLMNLLIKNYCKE